jgi:hypothetical protein
MDSNHRRHKLADFYSLAAWSKLPVRKNWSVCRMASELRMMKAYDALFENGRFFAWLRFAPEGIIIWKG